ncbi:MAG: hypothetical protein JO259_10605 [Mycobacterium sp.]|nr:hypothetical protein [Mycobacterium sp.]
MPKFFAPIDLQAIRSSPEKRKPYSSRFSTLVVISHDAAFLDRLGARRVRLERGKVAA